jgi:phosphoserine phosphatase
LNCLASMVKLICFDMDGVIFEHKNFWMQLHKVFDTYEEGLELTNKYLRTDYKKLVEEVVGRLWKGKDATPYYNLIQSINYLPGVQDVFKEVKRHDWMTAIISSASIDLARRAQHDLGIDFVYANELVIVDNVTTGEMIDPIGAGQEKKAQIVRHLSEDLGISLKDIIFVGDGDIDIAACKIVGTSIAFNSHSNALKEIATHTVDDNDLRRILPILPAIPKIIIKP